MITRAMVFALSGVLVASGATGAAAQSATADDYVATVRQDVVFLAEASRLAEQRSASDQVKAFARAEAADQQRVADNLGFWEAERGLSAFAPSMLVASNGIETATDEMPDTILTGRSAAIDPGVGTSDWSRPDPGVAMVSPGVLVMPQLTTLSGDAFDKLYKTTQAVALKELAGFYEAYSLTGKDAALKAAAARQLPLVRQRLADLEAL